MIQFKNISVHIDGKEILKNISCTINKGDFVVIVGPNGAGKTTLLHMMSGKCTPTHGTIMWNNQDITHTNERERSGIISHLFQNPQMNGVGSMTVMQNLALSNYKGFSVGLSDGMSKFPSHLLDDLLHLNLGSKKILHTPMKNLSGGQRQLLAFIMATAQTPQLFLLDEPTAALDPLSATKLLQYAVSWIEKHAMTTVLITHDPELALTIGKKIWILENGTISRQYDQKEQSNLSAKDLIGHIDYASLIKV